MTEMVAEKLEDGVLERFMTGFFGYGNPAAPLWLIGMEEGAGRDSAELKSRIDTWALHEREFEDVRDYHIAFGLDEAFSDPRRPERTWGSLIRMLLRARGLTPTEQSILAIQRARWARFGGNVCLTELLPLPKRSRDDWSYDGWTNLEDLRTKATYDRIWGRKRRELLMARIEEYQPELVIFYGTTFRNHWNYIAHGEMAEVGQSRIWHRKVGKTDFVLVLHPSPRSGSSRAYFDGVGDYLRKAFDPRLFASFG